MKVVSNKVEDLLSQFDNINENDIPILSRITDLRTQVRSTPHQNLLIDNHIDANKDKSKGFLYLEDIFGFCRSFKNVTKNLGCLLMLKNK